MVFWRVFFAVMGVGFATESLGLFAHELNLALALLCLALSAVMKGGKLCDAERFQGWRLVLGIGISMLGLFFLGGPWSSRLFAGALWFYGLYMGYRGCGADPVGLLPMGAGCLGAGIFHWLAGTSLLTWHGLHHLCRGYPVPGPSFSSPVMLVFTGVTLLAAFLCSTDKRRKIRSCLLTGVVVLLMYGLYLGLYWLGTLGEDHWLLSGLGIEGLFGEKGIVYLPAFSALFLGLPLGILIWRWSLLPQQGDHRDLREERDDSGYLTLHLGGTILVFALAALSVFALTSVSDHNIPSKKTVAFYTKGFMNWQKPTKQRYGKYSAGMFGQLPRLVESMGWGTDMLDTVDAATLSRKDILVIINQNEPLPETALLVMENFVRQGGSLLVLGDHTFWKEDKKVPENLPVDARAFQDAMLINQPIRFSDIRIKFDSADYFIGGWLHSYRAWPHGIGMGSGDHTNEPGVVVGASLDVQYPAVPLLVGRYGYSDPGERTQTKRGYLGNLDYDPGEPLGDVVLAAAQNVGQGRVVVFGDTSGFTNAILTRTYPFVHRVFAWLGSRGEASVSTLWDGIGLAAAGAAFLIVMLGLFLRPGGFLPLSGALCFLLFTSMAGQMIQSAGRPLPLTRKVAVVDYAHLGHFSLEGWDDQAVDGVFLNLMREDYFVLGMKRFDRAQVMAADLFVSMAPSQPFCTETVDVLMAFMRKGGTVILTAGWEDRAGVQPLLERVGLRIPGRPLGRTFGVGTPLAEQPFFLEAWPVIGKDAETLATIHGDPVAVRKKIDRGSLVVIGDAQFFCNKNFEVEDGGVLRNIRFFYWLLEESRQPGPGPQAPGDG